MDKELKQLLQEQMKREAEEIMEEVNSDPNVKDVVAPESIRTKLFQQIREYEESQAAQERTEEEEELIRLGKVYRKKKKRKWTKVLGAVAIMAILGAFVGVTAMGGPEKVFEKIRWTIAGKEQENIDTDSDKVRMPDVVGEDEAYEMINEAFGFYPVKLIYLPEGVEYKQASVEKALQMAQIIYGKEDLILSYMIQPSNRTGSWGTGIEDAFMEEETKRVSDVPITIKQYVVEENQVERWQILFEWQDAQYCLETSGLGKEEIVKIVDNLCFR